MNLIEGPAAPASGTIPTFAELAADPEIAPLLDFEPVARKVKRPDGWTDELQRELIARIAATGTLQSAVSQMGKHATGAEALYKTASAESFRASWDAAIVIGRRRNGLDSAPPFAGAVPGIAKRGQKSEAPAEPEDAMSDDRKFELVSTIGARFMRKVAAERQARLSGEIVAADFYLRQVTFMEVLFDLSADALGFDAHELLNELRRGEHGILDIATTSLSDWLDDARRLWWAREGQPERPPHPDSSFLEHHYSANGDYYTTQSGQDEYGAITTPARGYDQEEWAAMSFDEQVAAREAQKQQDAEEQLAWERRAHKEWAARAEHRA